jgi:CrcB protein
MWKQWLIVFLGGGLGSALRFAFQFISPKSNLTFPWATLGANLLGCFLFGLLAGYLSQSGQLKSNTALFLLVGFCGGLTTFSSLINDGQQLLQQNTFVNFVLYNGISFGLGLSLLYLGYSLWK